jgi:hypothetical protein
MNRREMLLGSGAFLLTLGTVRRALSAEPIPGSEEEVANLKAIASKKGFKEPCDVIDEYIRQASAYVLREPVDEVFMQAVEEGAGITEQMADDHRRQICAVVGANLALGDRRINTYHSDGKPHLGYFFTEEELPILYEAAEKVVAQQL